MYTLAGTRIAVQEWQHKEPGLKLPTGAYHQESCSQPSQNSTSHITHFQNLFDTDIRIKKLNNWALVYTFHTHCSPVKETRVRSNKITQPSHQLFQLPILTKARRLTSSSALWEHPVNIRLNKRFVKTHWSHWFMQQKNIQIRYIAQ